MTTPLSCSKIKSLIESVHIKRAIWDKSDQNHHNGAVLTRLWQQVAADCDMTVFHAKGKWKRLRESFGKRFLKLPPKIFADGKITVDWPYFKSLIFLKDQFSFSVQDGSETFESLNEEDETFNETKDIKESVVKVYDIPFISLNEEVTLSSSSSSSTEGKRSFDVSQCDKSQLLYGKNENTRQVNFKGKTVQNEVPKAIDEDVSFFNSIAPYIQALTPKHKMQFRIKVLQILDEMLPDSPISSLNNAQY